MKSLLIVLTLFSTTAFAQGSEGWSFNYGASAGSNSVQGTHFTLFAQLGTQIEGNLSGGFGGYFSAGEKPEHDREYGVGPFLSYALPLTDFLIASARQEINYVNLHDPYLQSTNPNVWKHEQESGVASATSAGVHLLIGSNFSVSVGYRLVVALSNSALDDGRSGPYFGLGLAF